MSLEINQLLSLYNPWWKLGESAFDQLPDFERPVLRTIVTDLRTHKQILSITGPRRVGKTTLLHTLVRVHLTQGW